MTYTIGITGGIGSGKSYICHKLEQAGFQVFYCDDEAKRIIRNDGQTKEALTELVGKTLYNAEGQLEKNVLRAYLCQGTDYSAKVNAIVHPAVANEWKRRITAMDTKACTKEYKQIRISGNGASPVVITLDQLLCLPQESTLVMECALLFESGFDKLVDNSVLIHVSLETQLTRLMARDHISESKARQWLALQLPEKDKMEKADFILIND